MSDFLNNLGKIGMVLQAGGGSLAGRDGMAVVRDWEKQQEDARKREAISGLLAQSGIGGIQRGLLEQLPVDQQAPAILNMLAQMEAQRRAGGAAAAAEARAAQEEALRREQWAALTAGAQTAPTPAGNPYSLGMDRGDVMPPSRRLSFGTPAAPVPQIGPVRMPNDASGLEARALRGGNPASVVELPPRAPLMQPQEAPPTRLSFGEIVPPAPAAAPVQSGPFQMYQRALEQAYMAPPGTYDPEIIKALEERVKFFAPPEMETTDDIREYQFAVKNHGYRGTLQEFVAEMRTPANVINNTVGGEGNNFGSKYWEERYGKINDAALAANDMLGLYSIAEAGLDSGVRTGAGAETELVFRQIGQALGMDMDETKIAGGEVVRAVQNRMALMMRNPDGGMGMPGAMSDADREFLKQSQVGLDRSPEGNKKLLQAFRAVEQRKLEIAQLADQYIAENGRLDGGFGQVVRDYADANPMFNPDFFGASSDDNVPTYNPNTGEWE